MLSEEIWNRFRTACDAFFEQKRAHFEEMDGEKQANLAAKEALCDRLEALDLDPSNPETVAAVDKIETEWKAIGMVPRDNVDSIWDRFCASLDKFLDRRMAIDPELKATLESAKNKKEAMLKRVVELMDNAGANQNADAVRALQPEWKKLPRCGSEEQELYRRFREACDEFFNRRRDQLEIQEQARENNLQKKTMLCEQAEKLLESITESNIHAVMNEVKHLRRLWKEIGAVPREYSDKVWARFNTACDAVFSKGRTENDESKEPQA
jgi:Sec-independent protein translocase protein TatA